MSMGLTPMPAARAARLAAAPRFSRAMGMCMALVGRASSLILRIVVLCFIIIMVSLPGMTDGSAEALRVMRANLTVPAADTRVGLADSQYLFGFNQISWSTGWPVLA